MMVMYNLLCYEMVFIVFIEVCEGVFMGILVVDCVLIVVIVINE